MCWDWELVHSAMSGLDILYQLSHYIDHGQIDTTHSSTYFHFKDHSTLHFAVVAPEEARFPDTETHSTGRESAWVDVLESWGQVQQGSSGCGDTLVG